MMCIHENIKEILLLKLIQVSYSLQSFIYWTYIHLETTKEGPKKNLSLETNTRKHENCLEHKALPSSGCPIITHCLKPKLWNGQVYVCVHTSNMKWTQKGYVWNKKNEVMNLEKNGVGVHERSLKKIESGRNNVNTIFAFEYKINLN